MAGSPRTRLPLLAVGLVLVLLAVLVVLLGVQHADRRHLAEVQRADGSALTAARRAGVALFSYDAGRLDADVAAALSLTTGAYTDTYRAGVDRGVRPSAAAGTSVTATVRQAGATAATTSDQLVALVLLDRTTRRAGDPDTVDSTSLRMTLVRSGGRWLVTGVETL